MKNFLKFITVLTIFLLLVACSTSNSNTTNKASNETPEKEEQQVRELKFSMSVGETSPWTKGAFKFAELVEEKSDGKIKVTVYPNGQLAGGNQITELELLQNGSIDITWHSSIILSSIDERFIGFSMPWIASSFEDMEKIMDGPGKQVWEDLSSKGVVPLDGYSSSGFRQITTKNQPIEKPEDLEKLKIRVPGISMYTSIFNELGANPTTMSFGELFVALQQGAVDGQENPISLIEASGYDEVQKYLSIWNYSADVIGMLINKELWESLDSEAQSILNEAAQEAAQEHRKMQQEADQTSLDELSKTMEITELNQEQINEFRKVMEPVYEEYKSIVGEDLIKEFQDAVSAN